MNSFKHKIKETVKFHEVDMLGVCNNAVYFNYFEDARIKYLQELKYQFNIEEILTGNLFFIMAHNYCDYLVPAVLDDELEVYTRISKLKNTNFEVEHIIVKKATKETIAKGGGVLVHINKETKKSVPLPKTFYEAVLNYEENVEVIKNT